MPTQRRKDIQRIVILIIASLFIATALYAMAVWTTLREVRYEKPVQLEQTASTLSTPPPSPEPTPITPLPTFSPKPTPITTPTPTPMPEMTEDIMNILIIGCDTRKPGAYEHARSDVNMILTIDKKNGETRLTSFLRDVLIYYEGYEDYQRLNFALRYYGDPHAVMELYEDVFGIEIHHFMIADFWGVASLIDIFGGVTVNASLKEIENLNDILWNLNELYGYDLRKDFVPHTPGNIRLSGRQAVQYMRIRKVGSDFTRVERQYEVLNQIKSKLMNMNLLQVHQILAELPTLFKTDMNEMELISTANTLFKIRNGSFTNTRVPFRGCYNHASYKGMSILDIDMDRNRKLLHDFIYHSELP